MEIIRDIEQGTPEWLKLRVGSIGGSSISKAVAKGDGKSREGLMYDLIEEIFTGEKKTNYVSWDMKQLAPYESDARNWYSFTKDVEVEQIALAKDGPHKHVSPDGIVSPSGIIEIKCVKLKTFRDYKKKRSIQTGYRKQMQWGIRFLDAEWCDYIVYCPALESTGNHAIIERVFRDQVEIDELVAGADQFIEGMLQIVEELKAA